MRQSFRGLSVYPHFGGDRAGEGKEVPAGTPFRDYLGSRAARVPYLRHDDAVNHEV